jgi:restriction system protein
MPSKQEIPKFYELMNPILTALHKLGGSGSIQELLDEIISDLNLPESVTEALHRDGPSTKLQYRAGWARSYLKTFGLLENSDRGVWALTQEGQKAFKVDPKEVLAMVRGKQKKKDKEESIPDEPLLDVPQISWRTRLLEILQTMDPGAFERLSQRLLREAGFIEVEVTGRSGDGGIDGYGTIRIGGLISFNVLFQCKRYKGSIGANIVRDFRGAMVGRADKGLIITTGVFTREARREATRDGAPPLDLIDGDLLVEKLKELRLGVKVEMVESVALNEPWFGSV